MTNCEKTLTWTNDFWKFFSISNPIKNVSLQERERRKQHMVMMKQLEAKKRCDERERKREELRLKTEIEREKRMEQKKLELELINEMRKPVEDMSLDDQKELPELERIPG